MVSVFEFEIIFNSINKPKRNVKFKFVTKSEMNAINRGLRERKEFFNKISKIESSLDKFSKKTKRRSSKGIILLKKRR